ncbi:Abi-alpha family protein [Nocardia jiangxiensis]|uniref:Abi-alpha family protein n=1 Tax=Nocardia jiangxiensis TaxID=282685 RepID=A0ABW6RU65_9NOCA|nr:Abi-alpha family protein [Nocardia jiangxiensis]
MALSDPVRAAAGLVQVAASAAAEATSWSVDTARDITGTVVRGSMAGRPPRELLTEAGEQMRESVRRALGIPAPQADSDAEPVSNLRERGAELLRHSARVQTGEGDHPAYARILSELTPDEARILRFLYLDGPQPTLDVRTGRALTPGTQRIEMGLNLIGEEAALHSPDRTAHYLTNLSRLGLIDFTTEPLDNPARYQLLEAQSQTRSVLSRSRPRAKIRYCSIVLTGFGGDFVCCCLPVPPVDKAQ